MLLQKTVRVLILFIYLIVATFGIYPVINDCNAVDCCSSCNSCDTAEFDGVNISSKCCDINEGTKKTADLPVVTISSNLHHAVFVYPAFIKFAENYTNKLYTYTSVQSPPSLNFRFTVLRI